MKIEHTVPVTLLTRIVKVHVIGAGGTGSALLPRLVQLHMMLIQMGKPGLEVTVWDSDIFTPTNLGRQSIFKSDIGFNKAVTLINRINMSAGLNWSAEPRHLNATDSIWPDIIIGCVDTRKSRDAILKSVKSNHAYYIDSGNSENSGQVIVGELVSEFQTKRTDRLPTVADLFPETVNAALDATDEKPSCSMAEAVLKQDPVINSAMAVEIFNFLWNMLHHGKLNYSGRFVNLLSGTTVPLRLDTDIWARYGYIAPIAKKAVTKKVKAPKKAKAVEFATA